MYKQKESNLVKRFIRWLNTLSQCYAKKTLAQRRGDPDVTGCLQGIRLEIEVKVPPNKPTKKQLYELKKWREAGAISGWADNFEELCEIIETQAAERGIKWKQKK